MGFSVPAWALCTLWALPSIRATSYTLDSKFVGTDFFGGDKWSFFSAPDPTVGAVKYVDRKTAWSKGMINATENKVYIGPKLAGIKPGNPIPSVRLESVKKFNSGLFVLSMEHMPTGCGVWPAFWMTGDDPHHPWPSWGEADFLEGAHGQEEVWTTLHTFHNCDQSQLQAGVNFSGHWMPGVYVNHSTNCSVHDGKQYENEGCPIVGPSGSMGTPFNLKGGGTYAFEWDPEKQFRAFFWNRGEEPDDIKSGSDLNPDAWGMPYAMFVLNNRVCPSSRFKQMKIILNTDFCGAWGQYDVTFHQDCPHIDANLTCPQYVSTYPGNLTEAYWNIERLNIYQKAKGADTETDEIII